jgi:hypothetical protein
MSLLDRIRGWFRPRSDPDHPLTEEERDEGRTVTTADESASLIDEFTGPAFDPDEDADHRTS